MAKPLAQRTRLTQWAIGIVCVALAWAILEVLPPEDSGQEPFEVPVTLGEVGEGRALTVTVNDVRFTDEVTTGAWRMPANWLVVDLAVMATQTETGALLSHAVLVTDRATYRASERPPETLLREQLYVGVFRAGALAFELPEDIGASAQLQVALGADPRLDSMITLDLDLGALDRVDSHDIGQVGWVAP